MRFDAKKWECFNSDKICKISYGNIQGKIALEKNFENMKIKEVGEEDGNMKVRPFTLNISIPDEPWL